MLLYGAETIEKSFVKRVSRSRFASGTAAVGSKMEGMYSVEVTIGGGAAAKRPTRGNECMSVFLYGFGPIEKTFLRGGVPEMSPHSGTVAIRQRF